MEQIITAHFCSGSPIKGFIRKYPSLLCSCCEDVTGKNDIHMKKTEIEKHNWEQINKHNKELLDNK